MRIVALRACGFCIARAHCCLSFIHGAGQYANMPAEVLLLEDDLQANFYEQM